MQENIFPVADPEIFPRGAPMTCENYGRVAAIFFLLLLTGGGARLGSPPPRYAIDSGIDTSSDGDSHSNKEVFFIKPFHSCSID